MTTVLQVLMLIFLMLHFLGCSRCLVIDMISVYPVGCCCFVYHVGRSFFIGAGKSLKHTEVCC